LITQETNTALFHFLAVYGIIKIKDNQLATLYRDKTMQEKLNQYHLKPKTVRVELMFSDKIYCDRKL